MERTRMGISAGVMAATIYFMGLFSGYFLAVVLVGYVLLLEKDEWLKRNAVRAVAVMIFFSILTTVINLVPNAVQCINNIAGAFNGYFKIAGLSEIIAVLVGLIDITEKILFMALGVKALNREMISIPIIDKIINKYIN